MSDETTVTMGWEVRSNERDWAMRCEYVGIGWVLSLGVSRAPAIRIIVFGLSFWVGKIPPKPKGIRHEGVTTIQIPRE